MDLNAYHAPYYNHETPSLPLAIRLDSVLIDGQMTNGNMPNFGVDLQTMATYSIEHTPQPHQGLVHQGHLACPFNKYDKVRYRRCRNKTLRHISDVTQHIQRCHMMPQHMDVSQETFRQFTGETYGTTRKERKWFYIWEKLFPGATRPNSIYHYGTETTERVSDAIDNFISQESRNNFGFAFTLWPAKDVVEQALRNFFQYFKTTELE
ncbi:hypothetical protein QBC38DRAFT_494131 [Podospora fimiseda]|uniref:Uncharacterized protein n=1 Tax=Podospora fimiseda TaxID=252190 RepID=A0AAN6YK16_9PEZI|nr:hypothetical protein QBC38DRAFT_494131 [Podospora fimiseda]